jgi:hypothetical protein
MVPRHREHGAGAPWGIEVAGKIELQVELRLLSSEFYGGRAVRFFWLVALRRATRLFCNWLVVLFSSRSSERASGGARRVSDRVRRAGLCHLCIELYPNLSPFFLNHC